MIPSPCPICFWTGGFHNDFPGSPHLGVTQPGAWCPVPEDHISRVRPKRTKPTYEEIARLRAEKGRK